MSNADTTGQADPADPQPPTDSTSQRTTKRDAPFMRFLRTVVRGLIALLILGAGVYAALWFNWTEGTVQAGGETKESARLVETVTVQPKDTRVTIRAMGEVRPAREVVIRPRVSGKIVSQHSSFVPGGHFEAGERMVQIDRSDYRDTVQQRQSDLARAKATLKIEQGDQAVAREELALLEADIPRINRDLILRKPQVNQARASVRAAEAGLSQAKRNLERTSINAPFDGHLVSRSVTAGNNVAQGDQLATLVGSNEYWVELAVPVSSLRWMTIPDGPDERGSPVVVTNDGNWGPNAQRRGRVARFIGRLEENSRLAQILVSIKDPLALSEANDGKPRMILDAFVDVQIKGRPLDDVTVIKRAYLREQGVVWVMDESDRLTIRDVSVAFRGQKRAYIKDGLKDGDRVVTTNLSSPVEDMLLRQPDSPAGQSEQVASREGDDDE